MNWNTYDGQWVGIWGKDWAELIGKEVLIKTDEYTYEVWQPDLRADQIYTYFFADGLVRKLFPAECRIRYYGFKKRYDITSRPLHNALLDESRRNKIVVHLNGVSSGINRRILASGASCPFLVMFLGEVASPRKKLHTIKKNMLARINDFKEYMLIRKLLSRVDLVSYCNQRSKTSLKQLTKAEMVLLYIGINCDFWKNGSRKLQMKKVLGLTDTDFVILSSSRLNSLKQIDKMIRILTALDEEFNFQYIVTGHGLRDYEQYLASIGEGLIRKNKLRFVGFLAEKELINYYRAADLFVISSLSEGAPISAIKALAMELPIFSTDTGLVAELLVEHNAGQVVPLRDYSRWEHQLREILLGKPVKVVKRKTVESLFHWPTVTSRYVDVYRNLYNNYYRG